MTSTVVFQVRGGRVDPAVGFVWPYPVQVVGGVLELDGPCGATLISGLASYQLLPLKHAGYRESRCGLHVPANTALLASVSNEASGSITLEVASATQVAERTSACVVQVRSASGAPTVTHTYADGILTEKASVAIGGSVFRVVIDGSGNLLFRVGDQCWLGVFELRARMRGLRARRSLPGTPRIEFAAGETIYAALTGSELCVPTGVLVGDNAWLTHRSEFVLKDGQGRDCLGIGSSGLAAQALDVIP